jgi:hypothetical protein
MIIDPLTIVIETLGWLGAVLVLAAYLLVSTDKIASKSRLYQWMNVVGAAFFIVNSGWNGAIPSATLNIIWMGIGVYSLWNMHRTQALTADAPLQQD